RRCLRSNRRFLGGERRRARPLGRSCPHGLKRLISRTNPISGGGTVRVTRGVKLAATLAISVVGFAVLLGNTAAGSNGSSKIEPRVLSDTANGKQATFVIYLKEQANLSAAYRMKDQNARGWYVYRALTKEAAR